VHCVFDNNMAETNGAYNTNRNGGGAIYAQNATLGISYSDFYYNYAGSNNLQASFYGEWVGGALLLQNCSFNIEHSYIVANYSHNAPKGGAVQEYPGEDCGLSIHKSIGIINRTTFAYNGAWEFEYGGIEYGIGITESSVEIKNSILWETPIYGVANISYSLVQRGYPGKGNINQNPLFGNGFSLMNGSPGINAGCPDEPLDPDGSIADMGAYTCMNCAPNKPRTLYYLSKNGTDDITDVKSGSKEKPFKTFEYAYGFLKDNDTLILERGWYNPINFKGKNFVLASNFIFTNDYNDILETGIDANFKGPCLFFTNGETAKSLIKGLTIKNGGGHSGGGNCPGVAGGNVYCGYSSPTFEYLRVINAKSPASNYSCEFRGGGFFFNNSNSVIRNCYIVNNILETMFNFNDEGSAIYAMNSNIKLVKTTIANNVGNGAIFASESKVEINSTIIWNHYNVDFGEVVDKPVLGGGTFTVTYSNIEGGYPGEGNIDLNPRFKSDTIFDLSCISPCINVGDPAIAPDPDGTRADMGASYSAECELPDKTIWYVSNSGTDFYEDNTDGTREKPFKTVKFAFNYANENDTIILEHGTYASIDFIGVNVVLASNFIFTKNYEDILLTKIDGYYSRPCLSIKKGEKPICIIKGLTLSRGGQEHGDIGGNVYCFNSSPTFEYLLVENAKLRGFQKAFGGGFYFENSKSKVSNCIIAFNKINKFDKAEESPEKWDYRGGGIFAKNANLKIDHTVIVKNYGKAAISTDSSTVELTNSIIWGNEMLNHLDQFVKTVFLDGTGFKISYSCLENAVEGEGNISVLPKFNNQQWYDLDYYSALRDAGDPNAPKDPDGTRTDIGAWWMAKTIVLNSLEKEQISLYPNPVSSEIFITASFDLVNAKIEIINSLGKPVYQNRFTNSLISVHDLQPGIYFIKIIANNKQYSIKFVKYSKE